MHKHHRLPPEIRLAAETNVVEQDHRGVKRVTRPTLGFKSFETAQQTLAGIELMHMLRKGQMADGVDQGLTTAEQFYSLAA
jgi:putative transposase